MIVTPCEIKNRITKALSELKEKQEEIETMVQVQSQLMIDYINKYISRMGMGRIVNDADLFEIKQESDSLGLPRWFLYLEYHDGSCYQIIKDQNFKIYSIDSRTTGRIDDTDVTLVIKYEFIT